MSSDDFSENTLADAARFYEREGYAVVRSAVPSEVADTAVQAFVDDVRSYRGRLYRQTTGLLERHRFGPSGFMMNPMLDIQDLAPRPLAHFSNACLRAVTASAIQRAAQALLGEPGRIVQTMFFDGNPSTWAHQDTYYLDADTPGRMAAVWIALEDIAPEAGSFFVYPRSHRLETKAPRGLRFGVPSRALQGARARPRENSRVGSGRSGVAQRGRVVLELADHPRQPADDSPREIAPLADRPLHSGELRLHAVGDARGRIIAFDFRGNVAASP